MQGNDRVIFMLVSSPLLLTAVGAPLPSVCMMRFGFRFEPITFLGVYELHDMLKIVYLRHLYENIISHGYLLRIYIG